MPEAPKRTVRSRAALVAVVICALAVSAVLGYVGLALHYESLEPNPKTDRFAAMLAELPPCPPAESAWYAYMDAMHPRHLGEEGTTATNMMYTQFAIHEALRAALEEAGVAFVGSTSWDAVVHAESLLAAGSADDGSPAREFIARVLGQLSSTRSAVVEASKVPVFGVRVPTARDLRSREFFGDSLYSLFPEFPDAEIGFSEAKTIHSIAILLEVDASHALATGDAERALVDLETIARMTLHSDEVRSTIGQMLSLSCRARVWAMANRFASLHPATWSDAQLARLGAALDSIDARGSELDLAWEEAFFEMAVSRFYSDDGAGDGVLLLKAILTSQSDDLFGRATPQWGLARMLLAPWYIRQAPSRAELTRDFEAHLDSMRARMAMPLWKRQRQPESRLSLTTAMRSDSDPVGVLVFTHLDRPIDTIAWMAHRDGARLALVIELFRRAHGRLPETMDELLAFARERKLEGPPAPWGLAPLTTDTQSGKPYRLEIVATEDGSQRVEIWSDGPQDPELADELWTTEKGFRVVPPHPLRRGEE